MLFQIFYATGRGGIEFWLSIQAISGSSTGIAVHSHKNKHSGFKFYIGNIQIISEPEILVDSPELDRILKGINHCLYYENMEREN